MTNPSDQNPSPDLIQPPSGGKAKVEQEEDKLLDRVLVKILEITSRSFANRSLESAEKLGMRLARLAQIFDKKHRTRTLSNLALAFPEWPESKRIEVANEMYRHFGRIIGDFIKAEQRTNEQVLESTEVFGLEHLKEAQSMGKGVIAITGHLGNWERMGHWMAATGNKLTVIARDANQGPLNEKVTELRSSAGIKVLSRGAAARGSLVALKRNEMVGILPDQNAGEIFIPFFGMTSGWVRGPGVLHKSTGAPILPVFSIWKSPGKYQMEIMPIIVAKPGHEVVEGVMIAIAEALELEIRKHPEQWLWMHDRWKSGRQQTELLNRASQSGSKPLE